MINKLEPADRQKPAGKQGLTNRQTSVDRQDLANRQSLFGGQKLFAGKQGFSAPAYIIYAAVLVATIVLCVSIGSVYIPFEDVLSAIVGSIFGGGTAVDGANVASAADTATTTAIIVNTRLPRVLCAALIGATLAVAGCAMQGLLKNPLADGSTLGVSAGASLGAVLCIALGTALPGVAVLRSFSFASTTIVAILFAFLSFLIILALAYRLDHTLATNTIILVGIIFAMFASALISLCIVFASSDHMRDIIFWTLGSLAKSNYAYVVMLAVTLLIFGTLILSLWRELNAFALSEDNARHVGVNVKRTRILILVATSALVGSCVSVAGSIAFVGLVTPHIVRMVFGPNHAKILPASLFCGAIFMMLCDVIARTALSPRQLPIGVITSLAGAVVFVHIFFIARKKVMR